MAAAYPVNQDCLDLIAQYAVDGSAEFMMWRTVSKSWASAAHTSLISAARQDSEKLGYNPRSETIPKDPYADTDDEAEEAEERAREEREKRRDAALAAGEDISSSDDEDEKEVPDWILAAWHVCRETDECDKELMRKARAGQMHLLIVKSDEMPALSAQLRASNQKHNVRCLAIAVHHSEAHIVSLNVKDSELGKDLEHLVPLIMNFDPELRGLEIR